jgi:predicted RecA/RadA family phage recombinase
MAELHQAGTHVDYTPSVAYVAGNPVDLGNSSPLWGIGSNDIAADSLGSLCIAGVYKFDKIAATAMSAGDTVGFDVSADQVVTSASADSDGNLGTVIYDAAASDEYVYVLLNGLNI